MAKSKSQKPTQEHLDAIDRLLDYFESQADIARALNADPSTVSNWFRGVRHIGIKSAITLSALLENEITLEELRPDIFE